MNIVSILKRSFTVLLNQWALWLFGALLALTTVNGIYYGWNTQEERREFGEGIRIHWADEMIFVLPGEGLDIYLDPAQDESYIVLQEGVRKEFNELGVLFRDVIPAEVRFLVYAFLVWLVVLVLIGLLLRYTSATALIRMVNHHEATGERLGIRQGFRLGWSRVAVRIFLIDLLVYGITAVLIGLAFLLAFSPLSLRVTGNTRVGVIGTLTTIVLIYVGISLAVFAGATSSLLRQLFHRACAMEKLGAIASIRRGFAVLGAHIKEILLVWVIWIAVRLLWMFAMVPAIVLLSPIILLFILVGTITAGLPALLIGGILSLLVEGVVPWIVAGLIGLPFFIVIMIAPILFMSGLVEVFKSNIWTLAFRDLQAIEGLVVQSTAQGSLPELDISGVA